VDYSKISPEELIIACLRSGEESAWVEFVRRFHPLIASVVFRTARQWGEISQQTVDDLVQETYLKLCADRLNLLRNFKATHQDAVYGYIKVFAANLAHDHFKALHAQKRGGSVSVASLEDFDAREGRAGSESTASCLERALLIQQVSTCLERMIGGPNAERDRRVFWLYYRVGLSASAIAALPTVGLSTKGVESTILRLTRAVRQQIQMKDRTSQEGGAREGIRSTESF
jgi:RNA polymerase sigma-70 factor (ECF subfamily)